MHVFEICSFSGLAGYYRRFGQEYFCCLAAPMSRLTKGVKFIWNKACDLAFQKLKRRLTSAHVSDTREGHGLHRLF